ncbi:MAG: Ppx/GppA family phosphatase [Acidobacteria bacterium]|nr:Ppx/GppA family phosphatase [Acidobacteriota bacterium]
MPRYAAVDIGSNSVRLAVAEVDAGRPVRTLAADREVTRLGESVFTGGEISREASDAVMRTFARFREVIESLHVDGARAVATSAVRDARNQEEFLAQAANALGMPVEIISGVEEARLIHTGVQSTWPHPEQNLLMIDIGGGSAEVICSEKGRMTFAVSKPLGAVRLKELFLEHDPPRPQDLDRLHSFIDQKIAGLVKRAGDVSFDRVVATSATAAAVICAVNEIGRRSRVDADRKRASTAAIGELLERLTERNVAGRRKIPGIGPRRAEIVVAGTAVLYRLLRAFGARGVYYSVAGVRDGIIADLAARRVGADRSRLDKDQRRIVETMARKYGVDVQHARKTAELAGNLFDSLKPLHGLPPHCGKLLDAAAHLADIGHYVSDMSHHRHSYYIVANADLPAFTAEEREIVAQLCRFHRKSMPAPRHLFFQKLPPANQRLIMRLVPLLRLADALDRSHDQRVEEVAVELQEKLTVISLQSGAGTNLEIWAGERAGEVFREVYGQDLVLRRRRSR